MSGIGAIPGFSELWDCPSRPLPAGESLKVCSGAFLSPPFRVLLPAALVPFFPTATVLRTLSKSRTQVDEGRIRSEFQMLAHGLRSECCHVFLGTHLFN